MRLTMHFSVGYTKLISLDYNITVIKFRTTRIVSLYYKGYGTIGRTGDMIKEKSNSIYIKAKEF